MTMSLNEYLDVKAVQWSTKDSGMFDWDDSDGVLTLVARSVAVLDKGIAAPLAEENIASVLEAVKAEMRTTMNVLNVAQTATMLSYFKWYLSMENAQEEANVVVDMVFGEQFPPSVMPTMIDAFLRREGIPYELERYEFVLGPSKLLDGAFEKLNSFTFKRLGIAELVRDDAGTA